MTMSFGDGTFGGPAPLPDTAGVLATFRHDIALILEGLFADVPVHEGPVDSLTPPAYMLVWPDQSLAAATACWYRVRLEVVAVGARIDPTPGYEQLEQLLEAAVRAFEQKAVGFDPVSAYLPLQVGGVTYLTARIPVIGTVTLEV
jgi:hypothetical protein